MANVFSEWYQGISRSRSDSQGFTNLVNVDVHSEVGFVANQLALASDTISGTPTEACVFAKTPNGVIYAFSKTTGKIWKLTSGTTWSVVVANANTTGHLGSAYYNGYIYYATATKLGRFTSEAETTNRSDSWQTFSNSSSYRPMEELNLTLFIGNGKDVASVNSSGTYTNSALDVPPNYTVTALAGSGVELLIGTVIGSQVNRCKAFLWDTYSDSWTVEDEIPEVGINCFIKNDDTLFAQCGTQGQLYYWSGSSMVRFRKIPNITTSVNPYASERLNGRCLFASGTKIFTIHREDSDLPYAIVQEYTTASGNVNAMTTYGSQLLVSAGTNVQKTGTAYATGYIDTPEVSGNIDKVITYYDSIGTGASVGLYTMIDNSGTFSAKTAITDTIKKTVYFDGGLGDVNFMQARVYLIPSGTNRVKIRAIETK